MVLAGRRVSSNPTGGLLRLVTRRPYQLLTQETGAYSPPRKSAPAWRSRRFAEGPAAHLHRPSGLRGMPRRMFFKMPRFGHDGQQQRGGR